MPNEIWNPTLQLPSLVNIGDWIEFDQTSAAPVWSVRNPASGPWEFHSDYYGWKFVATGENAAFDVRFPTEDNEAIFDFGSYWVGEDFFPDYWCFRGPALCHASPETLTRLNILKEDELSLWSAYDDASNYRSASLLDTGTEWKLDVADVGTYAATPRPLNLAGRVSVEANGSLLWATDGVATIGASSANRPVDIYASSRVQSLNFFSRNVNGYFRLKAGTVDGVGILSGATGAAFSTLHLGPQESGWPSLKVSGTEIQTRLGDDSAFSPWQCGALTTNGALRFNSAGSGTPTDSGTVASWLPVNVGGTAYFLPLYQ